MKKMILFVLALATPLIAGAHGVGQISTKPTLDIPSYFMTSGETKTLEWGCPIENELVESENPKSALKKLVSQCLDQVSRAAELKPEVSAVLQASVIYPNLTISAEKKGIHLVNGTIFLQTVVSMK